MKNLFNVSGLLFAMLFASCADISTESPEPKNWNKTRGADPEEKDYYWSGGRKIYLDTDYTKMIVGFDSEEGLRAFAVKSSAGNPFIGKAMALIDVHDAAVERKISAAKAVKNKIFANTFSGYDNAPFFMTGEIVMQPKEGVSAEEILATHDVDAEIVNKTDVGIVVRLKDWKAILPTANAIYESGMVDWCHPNFIAPIERTTNDPYFSQQYYLKNSGQTGGRRGVDIHVEPAWAISTGANIRVAVIDDGVEDHDDLAGRVLQGFTPRSLTGYGKPTSSGAHGQACAGIIAASHNTMNTAGVAPSIQIVPVNIFYGGETIADLAAAMEYAWNPNKGNADVISNSWGYNSPPDNADVLTQQIKNALGQGRLRNGVRRGCVIVFAAGNNGGAVSYPASLSHVIAVGAMDKDGTVWSYSSKGSDLDVVAPSGDVNLWGDVYTLDRMGANGYETGNYTARFGGTSAAAPQVAGIAALILSVDPDLRAWQVRNIIEQSTQKIGPGYEVVPTRLNGLWSRFVGYGLVDACAAVSAVSGAAPSAPFIGTSLSEVDPGDLSLMGLGYEAWNIAYLALGNGQATCYIENYDSSATYVWSSTLSPYTGDGPTFTVDFASDTDEPMLHNIECRVLKNGQSATSGIHLAVIPQGYSY